MNMVTIEVSTPEKTRERLLTAFDGKEQGSYISFPDTESLWKTFTPKRWQVIQEMTGVEAMAIRELSRRLDRDVRGSALRCTRVAEVWRVG